MASVPKKLLVTGGCGFIGSNFVNYIFKAWPDTFIVNLDKLILQSDAFNVESEVRNSNRYKLFTGDIKNQKLVSNILNDYQIDTVIHLGADCTSVYCYGDPVAACENNLIAFIEFLEACKEYGKLERFIHISTDEVYGDSELDADEKPKREDCAINPSNPYAATKAGCEAYCNVYRISFKLPIVILRINNIYGPNQWDIKVVPRFIKAAVNGEDFPIQGDGSQLRSWLFTEDAAKGIQMATEKARIGQIYNLGTYFEMNVRDLAKTIQQEVSKQLGRPLPPAATKNVPDRPYNDLRYLIDISKAYEEIGWKPEIDFSEGMRRTVASYLKKRTESMRMNVVIYGGGGWIGRQYQDMLKENNIPFELAECRVGKHNDDQVEEELARLCPTHVVSCTGRTHGPGFNTVEYLEGGPDKCQENLRDNLYCIFRLAQLCQKWGIHFTYVGTAYIFKYDAEHPAGGPGFLETDIPNYFGNSYSVVKGFTDRMMHHFNNTNNARINVPLNFSMTENRNLLKKLVGYPKIFDIPQSLTILPDALPILMSLMYKRWGGTLNLMNPGPISLNDIKQLYKELVDPSIEWERIGLESPDGQRLYETKAHNTVDSTFLLSLVNMPTAYESLYKGIKALTSNT